MPAFPAVSGKAIVRALERDGFETLRVSGSHQVLRHPDRPGMKVVVPVHGNRDLPRGTIGSILDQAGLSRERFLSLL